MNGNNIFGNTSYVSFLTNFKKFKIPIFIFVVFLIIFFLYSSFKSSQVISTVSVTATAEITAKPDTVSFVVTFINNTSDTITGINSSELVINKLIDIIKKLKDDKLEIKKTFYQITPQTSGFTIASAFSVKTSNLENLDNLIKELYSNGATSVSNVTFKSDDIKNVETQLRQKVFQDAKDKASRIAKSSGKRLGKIISITDDGTSNTSTIKDMQSNEEMISISKSISVVYQLK